MCWSASACSRRVSNGCSSLVGLTCSTCASCRGVSSVLNARLFLWYGFVLAGLFPVPMIVDGRMGDRSQCRFPSVGTGGGCRVDEGALCLSSSPNDSFRFHTVNGSAQHIGQAQGPHPSTSSAPCPYSIGAALFIGMKATVIV